MLVLININKITRPGNSASVFIKAESVDDFTMKPL
jgi:hypothetical protein